MEWWLAATAKLLLNICAPFHIRNMPCQVSLSVTNLFTKYPHVFGYGELEVDSQMSSFCRSSNLEHSASDQSLTYCCTASASSPLSLLESSVRVGEKLDPLLTQT